jgi:hypothetical protein
VPASWRRKSKRPIANQGQRLQDAAPLAQTQ